MIVPIVVLLTLTVEATLGEREHKVHNIVLYPERHSWCQTTPIKQIVAMPGYEPLTIDNNVCVGACYSYSIPRTQPAEPGELIGPYCDSCQPLDIQCYHVTLQADDGVKTIQKRVQIITNCSCSSCNKEQTGDCEIADQNTLELPTNLFSHQHQSNSSEITSEAEVPELLNLSHPKAPASTPVILAENATNEQRYEINAKLISLLKSIQNQEDDDDSNLNYDRDQLKELLEIIEGSEHELSYQNLMEFVNFINVHNSEDLELDLSRLNEVLVNFRREQESKPNISETGERNNANVEADLEELGKKYNIPKNFGLEGSHAGLGHHKGSHIGMGLVDTKAKIDAVIASQNEIDNGKHKGGKLEIEGGKGHHHVGEVQHVGLKVGHLIHGPHGSLVVAPDAPGAPVEVEEKLNLASGEVRPNHEGVVVSYENHHRMHHHGHHKHQPPNF